MNPGGGDVTPGYRRAAAPTVAERKGVGRSSDYVFGDTDGAARRLELPDRGRVLQSRADRIQAKQQRSFAPCIDVEGDDRAVMHDGDLLRREIEHERVARRIAGMIQQHRDLVRRQRYGQ